MKKLFTIFLIFLLLPIFSMTPYDENNDGSPDKWVEEVDGLISLIKVDTDFDGKVDYIREFNDEFLLKAEMIDFNKDGEMDDFYFYVNEVLIRREIDSNYDSKVDIWVYIDEGVYIKKYEKDKDFDGEIDFVKDYSENS